MDPGDRFISNFLSTVTPEIQISCKRNRLLLTLYGRSVQVLQSLLYKT